MAFPLRPVSICVALACGALTGVAGPRLWAAEPGAPAGRAPAAADQKANDEPEEPTPAPLTVGSMAIASDVDLAIEAMAIDVAVDRVTYSYRLRNKGKAMFALAASVTFPDLEVNSDGTNVYDLPSQVADNPVNLVVKANDQPITTKPYVQAVALGIDRLAELKASGFPLIPFDPVMDKAIAAASPDVLTKLARIGLFSPRDPTQPDGPIIADWSLRVVRGWTQPLDAGAVTNLAVSFTPIKAAYHVPASSLAGFDVLKDQVCLTPALMTAARAILKGKNAQADVEDITLANDGPARWLDNPVATIAVRKPQPNSVVAFCGMDLTSAGRPVVTGKMPGSGDAPGLRVLIFSAAP